MRATTVLTRWSMYTIIKSMTLAMLCTLQVVNGPAGPHALHMLLDIGLARVCSRQVRVLLGDAALQELRGQVLASAREERRAGEKGRALRKRMLKALRRAHSGYNAALYCRSRLRRVVLDQGHAARNGSNTMLALRLVQPLNRLLFRICQNNDKINQEKGYTCIYCLLHCLYSIKCFSARRLSTQVIY